MGCISGTKRATKTLWIPLERGDLMLSKNNNSISVALLVLEILTFLSSPVKEKSYVRCDYVPVIGI